MTISLRSGERLKYSELFYIGPGTVAQIVLVSVTIVMRLPKYRRQGYSPRSDKGTKVCFAVQPTMHQESSLLPSGEPVMLVIKATERVLDFGVEHKQPAFLGERYPISLALKQTETYEVTSMLATFCEYVEDEKSRQRVRKLSSSSPSKRRASVVSSDSADPPDWSYVLFVKTPAAEDSVKLQQHNYSLPVPIPREQTAQFSMQFREEGRKGFELILRYTAHKTLRDGTKSADFTLENKAFFTVEVLCPFVLVCEWLTPEPCLSTANSQFYCDGLPRVHVGIGKKALLGVRLSTGSYPEVEMHSVRLKLKENEGTGLADDCTPPAVPWTHWPLVLGPSESFSATYSILPTMKFTEKQIGDLEIVWNRAAEAGKGEKITCAIPVWPASAVNYCIDVSMVPPLRAVKYREFFVTYSLKNTTGTSIEIKVVTEESPHFFIIGEINTQLVLPPYETDELKFGLIPLRCGKFDLPITTVSVIIGGGVTEPIVDRHFSNSIYVFPS